MRPAGFTLAALLVGVAAAAGQPPPPVPGQPPAPPPGKLDEHLAGWEKTMSGLTNFRFALALKRTEATFKQDRTYSGIVLCMKPNYAVLRLNYDGDKTKEDYEAFICDGKAVYEYNGLQKRITEWKLPDPKAGAGATDNLMLDFLSGLKAKQAKERFDLALSKEDASFVYLDVKPRQDKDKAEFQQLRMALYRPGIPRFEHLAYLPAQVYLVKPNNDSEMWTFTDPQTNVPGLTPKDFQFQPVKGWPVVPGKAPAPPGPPPKPGVPAGGAVRP